MPLINRPTMLEFLYESLINGGVPHNTIVTLLMFPIIATLIVVARQVIGIKSFGIYTPLIITFAFIEINIRYGAAIFILSLAVATLLRYLLRKFRMLYLPKMALILSITTLTMFGVLFMAVMTKDTVATDLSVYQILIIVTLVEKFINVQIEKGYNTALFLALETLVLATIGYFIVTTQQIQDFVVQNPIIIPFFFLLIILLGRYEGLRITEYIRFRKLFETQDKNR